MNIDNTNLHTLLVDSLCYLEELIISRTPIIMIDTSANTKLKVFKAYETKYLEYVDFIFNKDIEVVELFSTSISKIEISSLINMTYLNIGLTAI